MQNTHFLPPIRAGLSVVALILALAWHAAAAAAPLLDKAALLGQSREEIESAFAGAERVRAPRRLPSGATGQLRQPDVFYEGAHFDQTFYFAQQKLRQIELVSLPGESIGTGTDRSGAFGALLESLKAQLGPELAAGDSASWVHGDTDVLLFRYGNPDRPTVRLVVRQRNVVEAGEL